MGIGVPVTRAEWVSLHLYAAESLDDLIRQAVIPVIDEAAKRRLFQRFFFIRYWEGGPHVRLRMLARNAPACEQFVIEEASAPALLRVERHAYVPEVKRYGGKRNIGIAETQFEASSCATLRLIGAGRREYDAVLGEGIQMHVMFAHAFGLTPADASRLFENISTHTLRIAGWLPPGLTAEMALARFEERYTSLRPVLTRHHRHLWRGLARGQRMSEEWAAEWIARLKAIAARLRAVRRVPAHWRPGELRIFESYVHMTNNRLGIVNGDEAFLAFLLSRSFREAA